MSFVEIAVEAPFFQSLTYKVPDFLNDKISVGSRVIVPLGKRKSQGVVLAHTTNSQVKNIKDITEITADQTLDLKTLEWLKWLSQYYMHPPGLVYSMAFAPSAELRKKKSKLKNPTSSEELGTNVEAAVPFKANDEQKAAIDTIVESSAKNNFDVFLLYGVTGSGKTEVYLQSINEILKTGKQVLVLVPEISLTPQLIRRFVSRFGNDVAVIHSHLTEREKSDQWRSALMKEKRILVGARSALFCPLENLGLIIVDEEHEASYKQEEQLKYSARDAAIVKAGIFKCPIVLGSATPSLESWHHCETGKYKKLTLSQRVENRPLPKVEIVDLRTRRDKRKDHIQTRDEEFLPSWLSPQLYSELKDKLSKKEQVALFLNRRGFAQFALCESCGFTKVCPDCSVTLTLHKRGAELLCHYCGFKKATPLRCPSCHEDKLKPVGLGTQKVAEELQVLFPNAKIARADRDEITSRKDLEELLENITNKKTDIVVGTQMIAKGHDFPELTLVGTLMADIGLHIPDFRSSERTFQLLTQVAGRAGRHQKEGIVIVQTYLPEHPAILCSQTHDFETFAKKELEERKELGYPPFGRLAVLRIQGKDLTAVIKAAQKSKTEFENIKQRQPKYAEIEILGPTESALARLKTKHRYQLLLKSKSSKDLNLLLQIFVKNSENWLKSSVSMSVDIDPIQFL